MNNIPSKTTRVAAIIPTWNRIEELEHCLSRLSEQFIPEWMTFEIIVIDDCSIDETPDFLRRCTAENSHIKAWRLGKHRGPGVARNFALMQSNADFLLLMDTDAWLQTSDGLARLVEFLRDHSDYAVVGGTTWADKSHTEPPFLRGGYLTQNLHADLPRWKTEWQNPHFVSSCCSVWRRSAIITTGGFDPYYHHGVEDVDVCLRIIRAGNKVRILPDIDAVHTLSPAGRKRQTDDFKKVFRYLEYTRPYLHLRVYGFIQTLRATIHWLRARDEFESAYQRPLSTVQRLISQILFPIWHLLLHPWHRFFRWPSGYLRKLPPAEAYHAEHSRA